MAGAQGQWTAPPPVYYHPLARMSSWDPQGLASSFNTMSLTPPQQHDWIFDTGATSHVTSDAGTPSDTTSTHYRIPPSIVVGNGSLLLVTSTGTVHLPGSIVLIMSY